MSHNTISYLVAIQTQHSAFASTVPWFVLLTIQMNQNIFSKFASCWITLILILHKMLKNFCVWCILFSPNYNMNESFQSFYVVLLPVNPECSTISDPNENDLPLFVIKECNTNTKFCFTFDIVVTTYYSLTFVIFLALLDMHLKGEKMQRQGFAKKKWKQRWNINPLKTE